MFLCKNVQSEMDLKRFGTLMRNMFCVNKQQALEVTSQIVGKVVKPKQAIQLIMQLYAMQRQRLFRFVTDRF